MLAPDGILVAVQSGFVFKLHVFQGAEQRQLFRQHADVHTGRIGHPVFSRASGFGGDHHHAVGTPGAIDGGSRSIFQHFDGFDV